MESCSSCPAGQYCSTEGLARPSGPCAAGFYCPFDFSSTTPYTFLCPKVSQVSPHSECPLCSFPKCHSSKAFPLSRRATTVPKALPGPCRVPQGSTSQTQAQTAASHVGLDFTVKKP